MAHCALLLHQTSSHAYYFKGTPTAIAQISPKSRLIWSRYPPRCTNQRRFRFLYPSFSWAIVSKSLPQQDTVYSLYENSHKHIFGGNLFKLSTFSDYYPQKPAPKNTLSHFSRFPTAIGNHWMLRPNRWCPFPTDSLFVLHESQKTRPSMQYSMSCCRDLKSTI